MTEDAADMRSDATGVMTGAASRAAAILALALLGLISGCADSPAPEANATAPGLSGVRYLAAGEADDDAYARATAPRPFSFPADHAPHPGFRTEWWYFTGNVRDASDRHYGFELTLFRVELTPDVPARESSLASHEVWMGNFAVTDTDRESFQVAERLSRGAPGIAGAGSRGDATEIAIEDWAIVIAMDSIRLQAEDDGFGIDLTLTGLERIVAQGNAGLDAKGPEPGNASYYFSAPRLLVTGELHSDNAAPVVVEGSAWMDREWSTSALSPDIAGWDWFALQLDDGRDLMFYRLREHDGGTSPFSGGSIVTASGDVTRIESADVELVPQRDWVSPSSGVRYPVVWDLALPGYDLELQIRPTIDAQEIDMLVRYWEGAIRISGRSNGVPITGVGYLELAGY